MSKRVIRAERYHDICCGHRVVDHESKCKHLHGHNYRFHFAIEAEEGLDALGRVLDFSVIKDTLCAWLEEHWDHKFLIYDQDPFLPSLLELTPESLVVVPFNPTAEQMAEHLLYQVAPQLLSPYRCKLTEIRIEETRKCSVTARWEE